MKEKLKVVGKAVRIGEDLKTFFREHPEIQLITEHGKVKDVILPKEVDDATKIIYHDKIYVLAYSYKGERFEYYSPLARKSFLYDLLQRD